jgi:hypothetical protein
MGYEPVCSVCGESVADYKGPCPKPKERVMEQTSEQLRKEIDHLCSIASAHWREATHKAYEIEKQIQKLREKSAASH